MPGGRARLPACRRVQGSATSAAPCPRYHPGTLPGPPCPASRAPTCRRLSPPFRAPRPSGSRGADESSAHSHAHRKPKSDPVKLEHVEAEVAQDEELSAALKLEEECAGVGQARAGCAALLTPLGSPLEAYAACPLGLQFRFDHRCLLACCLPTQPACVGIATAGSARPCAGSWGWRTTRRRKWRTQVGADPQTSFELFIE